MIDNTRPGGLLPMSAVEISAMRADAFDPAVCCGDGYQEQLFDECPDIYRTENQRQINSCAGNAGTTCAEGIQWQDSGEKPVQLSRMWLYVNAQRWYMGRVADQGATLGAIARCLLEKGCPPEDLAPYTGQFYQQFSKQADEAADQYRIKSTLKAGNYREWRQTLGAGLGTILWGCGWGGVRWSGRIITSYTTGQGGGHALAGLCLSTQKDSNGNPFIWCHNSHGDGPFLLTPAACDAICRDDMFGNIGLSEMQYPNPRGWDWRKKPIYG